MIILVIVALYLAAGIIMAMIGAPYAQKKYEEDYSEFSEYRTLIIMGALIWTAVVGPAMAIKPVTIGIINNIISHFKKKELYQGLFSFRIFFKPLYG